MSEWPQGYTRTVLDTVDSTLDEGRRRLANFGGPEWIMARAQTAARGRRGRAWSNPQGNFAATLVLHPDEPPAQAALRSFVAAIALSDALASLTGRPEQISLKWPNDVLLNGGKVAGILLESAGAGAQISHLLIGIGVNLIGVPDAGQLEENAVRPVSVASETGVTVAQDDFLDTLAAAYANRETQFGHLALPRSGPRG